MHGSASGDDEDEELTGDDTEDDVSQTIQDEEVVAGDEANESA